MTNKFGLDPESKEKALKVFRYQMTWPILWFERFSGCKEDNGFEGVNLEKVVFIIEQREDDIFNYDCDNEVCMNQHSQGMNPLPLQRDLSLSGRKVLPVRHKQMLLTRNGKADFSEMSGLQPKLTRSFLRISHLLLIEREEQII